MKGEKIRKSLKVWPCSPFGTLLEIPFLYLRVLCLSEGTRKRTATHESCKKNPFGSKMGSIIMMMEVSRGGDEPAGP